MEQKLGWSEYPADLKAEVADLFARLRERNRANITAMCDGMTEAEIAEVLARETAGLAMSMVLHNTTLTAPYDGDEVGRVQMQAGALAGLVGAFVALSSCCEQHGADNMGS